MTVILEVLRIVLTIYFADSRYTILKDVDYKTLYDLMHNGLVEYYQHATIEDYRALYLYFWYFIFYPFYLIPLEIGVWIWDGLRIASSVYVGKNFYKVIIERNYPVKTIEKAEVTIDLCVFLLFGAMGFFADMYLNNTNWLIQLCLFQSYKELKKGNKLLSGLLFVVVTYKINVIVFPFLLLYLKKISFKDLKYYLVPFAILMIPYMIFPQYFWQMYGNWIYIENEVQVKINVFLYLYLISWQAFQTGQLMYVSMLVTIFFENIKRLKNIKIRWAFKFAVVVFIAAINISFPVLLWMIYEE